MNLIGSLVGGLVSGVVIAAVTNYRDQTVTKPSVAEKMKALDAKLYEDGKERAMMFEKIKQDAELAADNT